MQTFLTLLPPRTGLHYEPTVLANVNHTMRVANEESFGPIMPIIKFKYRLIHTDIRTHTPHTHVRIAYYRLSVPHNCRQN